MLAQTSIARAYGVLAVLKNTQAQRCFSQLSANANEIAVLRSQATDGMTAADLSHDSYIDKDAFAARGVSPGQDTSKLSRCPPQAGQEFI